MDLDSYLAAEARIGELVAGAAPDRRVPACPAWRVRDVVAHLAGLCQDWVTGNLDGYASADWTDAQITRFAGSSVPEILGAWDQAAQQFATLPDDPVMGRPARWAFGDAVTHEADLRGALDAGRVPGEVVAVALKGAIGRWRQVLGEAKAPTVLLRAPDLRDWWLGVPGDPGAITVEAAPYEVFRALAGRRSLGQVWAWGWSADPSAVLKVSLPYPFSWAGADLSD